MELKSFYYIKLIKYAFKESKKSYTTALFLEKNGRATYHFCKGENSCAPSSNPTPPPFSPAASSLIARADVARVASRLAVGAAPPLASSPLPRWGPHWKHRHLKTVCTCGGAEGRGRREAGKAQEK